MQTILVVPTISRPTVSLADTHHAARAYVATAIDPTFEVVSDTHTNESQVSDRTIWRFFILCAHSPLYMTTSTTPILPMRRLKCHSSNFRWAGKKKIDNTA